MTKDYETRLREEFGKRYFHVSKEGALCVLNAIDQCSATCASIKSKNFLGEIKDQAFGIAGDADAYEWLKRNGIVDLTPAFCAGARHIKAVACWFIKRDALKLVEELESAMK
jgi:hypothetical protein